MKTTKLFRTASLLYLGQHSKIVHHIMSLIKRKYNLKRLLNSWGFMESIWITIVFWYYR